MHTVDSVTSRGGMDYTWKSPAPVDPAQAPTTQTQTTAEFVVTQQMLDEDWQVVIAIRDQDLHNAALIGTKQAFKRATVNDPWTQNGGTEQFVGAAGIPYPTVSLVNVVAGDIVRFDFSSNVPMGLAVQLAVVTPSESP